MLKKLLAVAEVGLSGSPSDGREPTQTVSVTTHWTLWVVWCSLSVQMRLTLLTTWRNWRHRCPDSDYDRHKEELNQLFDALNESGVQVYLAHEDYFPSRHRGIYDVKGNNFFLNKHSSGMKVTWLRSWDTRDVLYTRLYGRNHWQYVHSCYSTGWNSSSVHSGRCGQDLSSSATSLGEWGLLRHPTWSDSQSSHCLCSWETNVGDLHTHTPYTWMVG